MIFCNGVQTWCKCENFLRTSKIFHRKWNISSSRIVGCRNTANRNISIAFSSPLFGNSSSAFFALALCYHFIFLHRDHYSVSLFRDERASSQLRRPRYAYLFLRRCISSAGKISCPFSSGEDAGSNIWTSCEFNICLVICTFDLELLAVDSAPGSLGTSLQSYFYLSHTLFVFETRRCAAFSIRTIFSSHLDVGESLAKIDNVVLTS